MDQAKYLERINYDGPLRPTFEVLQELQKAHLLHVPFENLDIHYGNKIELDIAKIYAKIVGRNRGGFCYELNGLFYELLKIIGFDVKKISARVYSEETGFSPEYDHMALIVCVEDVDHLIDVGFGRFAFGPLKLEINLEQEDPKGFFRLEKYSEDYWQVSKKRVQGWAPEYIFTLTERALNEYSGMCHYHQTSPESHFKKKPMCSLPTESGRITVARDKVLIKAGDTQNEIVINNEGEFLDHLWRFCKVKI